jgi:hypothetical protein
MPCAPGAAPPSSATSCPPGRRSRRVEGGEPAECGHFIRREAGLRVGAGSRLFSTLR